MRITIIANCHRPLFTILLAIGLGIGPLAASADLPSRPRLVVFQGFVLLAYYDNEYFELKRLPPSSGGYYGYGWLNRSKDKVFVAYQPPETAEAIADLEIFDLKHKRIVKLAEIGGVGDSSFSANASRGEIIYNNPVSANDPKSPGIVLMSIDMGSNKFRTYHINNVPCWAPFWIDDHAGGCIVFNEKESREEFVKFPIPDVEQLKTKGVKAVRIPWSNLKWTIKESGKRLGE